MSYIHEALKKAQVERDRGKSAYGGIPAIRRKKSIFTSWKVVLPVACLLLVLLAFAGYSWWDQRTGNRGKRAEGGGRRAEVRRQNRDDKGLSSVVPRPSPESRLSPAKQKTEKSRTNLAEIYQKARALHRAGRLTDAALWYDKVLSMDPGHVTALNNRGVLYLQEKNDSAAQKCFEKAIRLKPDYVDPYYNLACVCALRGQVQQGLRYLQKALLMNPDVKKWAEEDPDLKGLRSNPRFQEIVFRKRVTRDP